MPSGIEKPRATFWWSIFTIAVLVLGVGSSRVPGLATVWDVSGGTFERRASQDARNDGYCEELLDAGERRGRGGWFTPPAEIAPSYWPRLRRPTAWSGTSPFSGFGSVRAPGSTSRGRRQDIQSSDGEIAT